ncbi:hypothetical protein ACTXT7_012330 [Hymenolepis weldensis]
MQRSRAGALFVIWRGVWFTFGMLTAKPTVTGPQPPHGITCKPALNLQNDRGSGLLSGNN